VGKKQVVQGEEKLAEKKKRKREKGSCIARCSTPWGEEKKKKGSVPSVKSQRGREKRGNMVDHRERKKGREEKKSTHRALLIQTDLRRKEKKKRKKTGATRRVSGGRGEGEKTYVRGRGKRVGASAATQWTQKKKKKM